MDFSLKLHSLFTIQRACSFALSTASFHISISFISAFQLHFVRTHQKESSRGLLSSTAELVDIDKTIEQPTLPVQPSDGRSNETDGNIDSSLTLANAKSAPATLAIQPLSRTLPLDLAARILPFKAKVRRPV